MITVVNNGQTNEYYGTSSDIKPTGTGLNASTFYEIDTGDLYMYDEENDTWEKQ